MSHVEQGYTRIPNTLLSMMTTMTDAEFKVVMAIARKTYGWHKEYDEISLSQLQTLTGLARRSVITGLQAAIERGILQEVSAGKRGIKAYRLVIIVGQSEETGEIFRPVTSAEFKPETGENFKPVNDSTGLKFRPVSDTTGLNSRPDTSLNFRPVSDATGLKFRPTKENIKTKKKGNKNDEPYNQKNGSIKPSTEITATVDDMLVQKQINFPTNVKTNSTETTPTQILEALEKISLRVPKWIESSEYFNPRIQLYGGDLIIEAIEQLGRQYHRRDWNMFEAKIEDLWKIKKRY